jgi:broad specificity phosphatase PhoE
MLSNAIMWLVMNTVYFLRHGTPVNPSDLVKGWLPGFPLSEVGRKQSHLAAQFLLKKSIIAIYSSPLLRCRQSAKILKEYFPKARLCFSKLLLEWATEVAGQPERPYRNLYFPQLKKYFEDPVGVITRMRKFCQRMIRKYPNQKIIAVGHGGPINALRISFEGSLPRSTTSGPIKQGNILKLVFSSGLDFLDSQIIKP